MDPQIYNTCKKVLGDNAVIFSYEETETIFNTFKAHFPIAEEGRIDCSKMKYCKSIQNIHQSHLISFNISQYDTSLVYILWNDMDLPAGQTCLQDAIAYFDKIEKLSFDVWIFNLEKYYVIESHHSHGITVGIAYNEEN